MHPNPVFRRQGTARNLDFVREQGFGHLVVGADPLPLISHIPFLPGAGDDSVDFHLVRSNPIARLLGNRPAARLAVTGPHGYISPDWYGIPDQVPTWNYVAVHLDGVLEALPQAQLPDLLERQSGLFERRLLPKPVWSLSKMPPDALERMLRQIVPVRMRITGLHSTWKLSQNKPDAARLAAADAVGTSGIGHETGQLGGWMRALPMDGTDDPV